MDSKKILKDIIAGLEDDYQHYTMVEKDSCKAFFIKTDIEKYNQILKDLSIAESTLEKMNAVNCSFVKENKRLTNKISTIDKLLNKEDGLFDNIKSIQKGIEVLENKRINLDIFFNSLKEKDSLGAYNGAMEYLYSSFEEKFKLTKEEFQTVIKMFELSKRMED